MRFPRWLDLLFRDTQNTVYRTTVQGWLAERIAILGVLMLVGCGPSLDLMESVPVEEPATEVIPVEAPPPEEAPAEELVDVTYDRGDIGPAGGIIFYIDRRGEYEWTYLEAAPAGWLDGKADPLLPWGEMGVEVGALGSNMGAGPANTTLIAAQEGDFAAKLVAGIEINEFRDWFLPSQSEIGEMYEQLFRRDRGELLREGYWTSTERTADRAMVRNFQTAGLISSRKIHQNRVRPIRKF